MKLISDRPWGCTLFDILEIPKVLVKAELTVARDAWLNVMSFRLVELVSDTTEITVQSYNSWQSVG